ncbi:glycosyltransferase [Fulvivirgaceae bacterium PWU4]|uniref:Glycosyltransferase n=1 Tax=Chryseosolibacter histidini TaxID=2782349 RepID=A0AAP2DQ65_9BACT|nr:glycosyltransferase [Chryseosolibacter histidini]MBT1700515.1 glycosyltransferase [Chryseosolibacter histidini]
MNTKKRLKIGVIFNFSKSWMGGVIYVINLVNALNFLDDEDKPEIILFYNPTLAEFTKEIQYPYLKLVQRNFGNLYKQYLFSMLKGKNLFAESLVNEFDLDGLYPLNDQPVPASKAFRKPGFVAAAWFPDLQHKFYPQFFTKSQLILREARLRLLLKNTDHLVLSSYDVASHFRKFYKLRDSMKVHVLHFASIIDEKASNGNIDQLREKYKLPASYYLVSNQFHNHKNHTVVLKALALLKAQNEKVHVAFTGKMESAINQAYISELKALISDNALDDRISLLGVIPRQDQLCLMKHAKAIVQPSLFEGWSTVIEDAISLQVPVIASDLDVNIEQLGEKGIFFKPHDEKKLAELLASFPGRQGQALYQKYEDRLKTFAMNFVSIFGKQR